MCSVHVEPMFEHMLVDEVVVVLEFLVIIMNCTTVSSIDPYQTWRPLFFIQSGMRK